MVEEDLILGKEGQEPEEVFEEEYEDWEPTDGENITSAYNALASIDLINDVQLLGKKYDEKLKTIQKESIDIIRKSISNIHERLFKEKQ